MKVAVTELQAPLQSKVPLDENNQVENLSLQMKIHSSLEQPEHQALRSELEVAGLAEASIARLRAGTEIVDGRIEDVVH